MDPSRDSHSFCHPRRRELNGSLTCWRVERGDSGSRQTSWRAFRNGLARLVSAGLASAPQHPPGGGASESRLGLTTAFARLALRRSSTTRAAPSTGDQQGTRDGGEQEGDSECHVAVRTKVSDRHALLPGKGEGEQQDKNGSCPAPLQNAALVRVPPQPIFRLARRRRRRPPRQSGAGCSADITTHRSGACAEERRDARPLHGGA